MISIKRRSLGVKRTQKQSGHGTWKIIALDKIIVIQIFKLDMRLRGCNNWNCYKILYHILWIWVVVRESVVVFVLRFSALGTFRWFFAFAFSRFRTFRRFVGLSRFGRFSRFRGISSIAFWRIRCRLENGENFQWITFLPIPKKDENTTIWNS